MANPHRGESAFEADGKAYTLRFSVDALCELEEAAGKGILALAGELSGVETLTLGLLRKVVWAGLREHHPDIDLKAAGELIVKAGGITAMMVPVNIALERAFPQGGGKRPPKGQTRNPRNGAGTGPHSTPTGAGSATTKPHSG